jgi:hypothetical protein
VSQVKIERDERAGGELALARVPERVELVDGREAHVERVGEPAGRDDVLVLDRLLDAPYERRQLADEQLDAGRVVARLRGQVVDDVLGQGLVLRFRQRVEPLIMNRVSLVCEEFGHISFEVIINEGTPLQSFVLFVHQARSDLENT